MPPNMSVSTSTSAGSSSVPPADACTRAIACADVLARIVDVVVPADRDRGELRQVADDHLGGVDQLGGQLPVRDDNDAKFHV